MNFDEDLEKVTEISLLLAKAKFPIQIEQRPLLLPLFS
jgi:hypothetical protein